MENFLISNEQARQFAYDCFDVIIRDIQAKEKTDLQKDAA